MLINILTYDIINKDQNFFIMLVPTSASTTIKTLPDNYGRGAQKSVNSALRISKQLIYSIIFEKYEQFHEFLPYLDGKDLTSEIFEVFRNISFQHKVISTTQTNIVIIIILTNVISICN